LPPPTPGAPHQGPPPPPVAHPRHAPRLTCTFFSTTGDVCLAADWNGAKGYLPNVFLTSCTSHEAQGWAITPSGTITNTAPNSALHPFSSKDPSARDQGAHGPRDAHAGPPATQCLDVGSGGSDGDLGFRLALKPVALPALQAYNSPKNSSWGGSVIECDDGK
jgi:hypothetical protein